MSEGFKKRNRQFRKRKMSSDSDEDSDDDNKGNATSSVLEDMREVQKLRRRQHGVSADELAAGKEVKEEQKVDDDPFKLKTGGYIDMKELKKSHKLSALEDAEQIGTSFAAETNRRDEDADMLKYVEEELNKRKGISKQKSIENKAKGPEDRLYELPENIKAITASSKRSEDMLSNQMLSGIPEVDLGIEAKIKNIESTEDAKQRLIQERMAKKEKISAFVPTNMAVNFVQHNRFNIEDTAPVHKKEEPAPKPAPVRVGDADRPPTVEITRNKKSQQGEKATDDFHYEKFKKQLRRY